MGDPDPPEVGPRVHQELAGESGVAQVARLSGPLVAGDAARVVPGTRQPVHVPHPGEHRARPLQLPYRLIGLAGLLQGLAQVVERPRLAPGVLVVAVPGQRGVQLLHRGDRIAVQQPGAGQLGQRPGLAALVAGAPVQIQGRTQRELGPLHIAQPQPHLTQLELRPRLPVQRLALAVQDQRRVQERQRLGRVRPVALHRGQRVHRPGPVGGLLL